MSVPTPTKDGTSFGSLLLASAFVAILLYVLSIALSSPNKTNQVPPYAEEQAVIFPTGTTDWKYVGANDDLPLGIYCLINNEWHRCVPLVNKDKAK